MKVVLRASFVLVGVILLISILPNQVEAGGCRIPDPINGQIAWPADCLGSDGVMLIKGGTRLGSTRILPSPRDLTLRVNTQLLVTWAPERLVRGRVQRLGTWGLTGRIMTLVDGKLVPLAGRTLWSSGKQPKALLVVRQLPDSRATVWVLQRSNDLVAR